MDLRQRLCSSPDIVAPELHRAILLLVVLILVAASAFAQAPYADWRTVETPNFRVHYPRPYEEWSLRVASRLEPIRAAVVREVGFDPPQRTDVLIMNPEAEANGLTYPLLDTPRIVLYAEAPEPESQIGEFGGWIDLLVTHEMTHLVHLLRPSRNPTQRALARLLPVSRITLVAPRWVLEGYATVVEGRLTGTGRPPGTMRAAILREWARNGRLPSYGQLGTDRRFLGLSMAYLVGSAYLEWLEARSGPDSLRHLWARLTARQSRTFSEAFEGVFGDKPERLYGKFVAELTERAVTVDRESLGDLRQGTLWQETTRNTGDPAVSPDGRQMAIVLRSEHGPAKLVVWSTAPAVEEEQKYEKRVRRLAARDPEDVAAVRVKPLSRKPLHSLKMPDGGNIETPRWTRDGQSILFTHRQPDRSGVRHRDLFLWSPASGGLRRVTNLEDVYDADPLPDGAAAVAVRSRYGFSQLVSLNLNTGEVVGITTPSLDRIVAHPRVSRDGSRIAFVAHDDGAWHLRIRDLKSGHETAVLTAGRANVASPEWSGTSDDLFATVLADGFADIHRFTPGGTAVAVTRVTGAAFSPAPSPDGALFFMSLEPEGFVVRRLERVEPAPLRSAIARSLVPALPPAAAIPVAITPAVVSGQQQYGIGHQEPDTILSGDSAPSTHTTEVGIRLGDVVGRLETIAVASLGSARSIRGATVASAWRGWPVELDGQLFRVGETIADRRGLDARAVWNSRFPLLATSVEGGVSTARVRDEGESWRSHDLAWAAASIRSTLPKINGSLETAAAGGDVRLFHGGARLVARLGGLTVSGDLRHDETRSVQHLTDSLLVGGIATTIMPRSLLLTRVLEPALATATLAGGRYTGAGVSIGSGVVTAFYRQHEIGDPIAVSTTAGSTTRIRVAGLEVDGDTPPFPILKVSALRVTLGAGRPLDGATRGRTQWWIGIRYEP